VIRRPHWRKENQCVMNRQQSISISGKHRPENHKGEGNTPSAKQLSLHQTKRDERPRDRTSSDQRDEIAPLHVLSRLRMRPFGRNLTQQ
jgi:hypothetical protein